MATLNGNAVTMQGKYYVLDTTVGTDRSVAVPALSGRQGDNGRTVYFAIKDGTLPHNMDGQKLVLVGKDSSGTPKVSDTMTAIDSSAGGLVQFTVPSQFYQADGPYTIAYFQIKKTTDDTVVSTINVNFEVLESATIMTTGQSEIYNNEMNNKMETTNKLLTQVLAQAQTDATNAMAAAKTAQASLDALLAAAKSNAFASKGTNNEFTGTNTFKGATRIDNLSSAVIDNLKNTLTSQINGVSQSVTNKMSQVLQVTDAWTRDYTLSGAISDVDQWKTNQFALTTYDLMDGLRIIVGRGDLKINSDNEYFDGHIRLPWVVDNADFAMAQCYYYEGYCVPKLGVMSRDLTLSFRGKRHEVNRVSLIIIGSKH